MTAYSEILSQIQSLSRSEQTLLFRELKHRLYDLQDEEDDFSDEELAESESEWQNYIQGDDPGKSLHVLELELFGGEVE